jgi:DtxR family Mn-dependent transcriptional regulator
MIGVKDNSSKFLKYADSLGLAINQRIKLIDRYEYDDLLEIEIKGIRNKISPKFAEQIIVVCNTCTKKQ